MLLDSNPIQFQTLDAWREFVAQTFVPLEIQLRGSAPFAHRAANDHIGSLLVTELCTNSTTVNRTSALVARSDHAVYKASLQLSGSSEIIQNNKRALLLPGQWAMYDTNQPYTVNVGDNSHFLVLQITPDLLSIWQPYLQAAMARCFDTNDGCGRLILQMLTATLAQRDHLSTTAADGAASAILHLIGAQLSEGLNKGQDLDPDAVRQVELLKIQHHIGQNLHRSDLNVDALCQVFKCSRRYLYNLFALQHLSPADYIQRQRLESSCQLLADPKYRRPIAELAYQHGFKDATAFSHAFRRRYGVSPTVWRQNHLGIT